MSGAGSPPRAASQAPAVALTALAGLNLLNYLDRYVLPAVVDPLERALHLNDSQFGTVSTAFMIGYFLTSPIFGWLGDRMPRKPLIAAGVAIWSLGSIFSGLAGGVMSLILFRVLVGFGEASFGTISPAWIADLFPPARRNLAISIFYLAIPVGSALGFIVGGAMAAHFGWRTAFLWAGVPGLLLALAVLKLREPARGAAEAPGRPPDSAKEGGSFRELLGLPEYRLVVAGYIAQTFALGGFGAWAAAFLQRVHHMDSASADRFFGGALAGTGLVATLAGGWLGAAWQKRSRGGYAGLLALSALGAAPAAYLTLTVGGRGWSEAALAAAMFLLFLPTGPINTLILETVPVALRARAMAASIFAIHLFGDLWSPKIIGMLSVHFGSLRRAIVTTLPEAIGICAVFWIWLALYSRSARTASAERSRAAG